ERTALPAGAEVSVPTSRASRDHVDPGARRTATSAPRTGPPTGPAASGTSRSRNAASIRRATAVGSDRTADAGLGRRVVSALRRHALRSRNQRVRVRIIAARLATGLRPLDEIQPLADESDSGIDGE